MTMVIAMHSRQHMVSAVRVRALLDLRLLLNQNRLQHWVVVNFFLFAHACSSD
jgi:hypothetical protein